MRHDLFETIWQLYQQRLLYFIRQWDMTDSGDLLQDVMLRVYENLDRYNPVYSFNTWIYTITRNVCINHVRKKRKRFGITVAPPSSQPDPESLLLTGELMGRIDKALSELNDEDRQTAYLRFHEAMSVRAISQVLDIPSGTVKSRIHRIRNHLTKSLDSYNED